MNFHMVLKLHAIIVMMIYELCPHCGFMANIDSSLLPPNVREKIRNKCEQDIYLYRKQVLKSELKGLEKSSKNSQIKMIKEIH